MLKNEFAFQEALFEHTIDSAKSLYTQDQLHNDSDTTDAFILSIENIQTHFELMVQKLFFSLE